MVCIYLLDNSNVCIVFYYYFNNTYNDLAKKSISQYSQKGLSYTSNDIDSPVGFKVTLPAGGLYVLMCTISTTLTSSSQNIRVGISDNASSWTPVSSDFKYNSYTSIKSQSYYTNITHTAVIGIDKSKDLDIYILSSCSASSGNTFNIYCNVLRLG
jgi:hypothetical protein